MGDKGEPRTGFAALEQDSASSPPDSLESTIPGQKLSAEENAKTIKPQVELYIDAEEFFQHSDLESLLSWLESKSGQGFYYVPSGIDSTMAEMKYERLAKFIKDAKNRAKNIPGVNIVSIIADLPEVPGLNFESKGKGSFRNYVGRLIFESL